MTGQKERVFPMVDLDNDIYIAYLPLAHILELCCGEFLLLLLLLLNVVSRNCCILYGC